ncbi:MAG: hypothetical protein WDM77_20850 [Steroidobacteraceae bacterium]
MQVPEEPRAIAQFVLDATVSALKKSTDAGSCTALIAKADRRFEAAFERLRKAGAPVACKSGCSFCCHLRVTLAPHEAIALFHYLKTQIPAALAKEVQQRVLGNADQIANMTPQQHWSTNVQCALSRQRRVQRLSRPTDGLCLAPLTGRRRM